MRAVVYDGDAVSVADDIELREPGDREVKVRIAAAGLCASDLSVVSGTIPYPTPVVLGHEGAGVVDEVGAGVTTVKPGDHVVLTTLGNCGLCGPCETGHPTLCKQTFGNLSQPFTRSENGEPLWNFANASVFAEFAVVKESQAIAIDPTVPLESACLIGCGVLTGFGAALNRAKVAPGDTAVVFGVGGIGLNVVQGCVVAGATTVVAVDANPDKEAIAREFGATHFVLATDADETGKALKVIRRDGFDHAFECVGHPEVVRQAIAALDWGGQCVLLGVPKLGTEASFVVADLYNDRSILGCRGTLIDDMKAGRLARGVLIP
ncbi:MAG: alcohol dehydrogenase catalytic domain-containing protein [Actinobacteria bacterium]|nr:alcohol dehydrogenase catalytic domain-containing protein [Actinomycetota bacterium]